MKREKSFWIEIVRIVANAIIAALTAFGITACVTVI